jgi:hypothetical protein
MLDAYCHGRSPARTPDVNLVVVVAAERSTWNWRILAEGGQTVDESTGGFPTLVEALDAGCGRLRSLARQSHVASAAVGIAAGSNG